MKFDCDYSLSRDGVTAETGAAAAALSEEDLTLAPKKGQVLVIPWEEIFFFSPADYKAELKLRQTTLTLSSLGYKFGDFVRLASGARNGRLLKLALADEPLKRSMMEADLDYKGPAGEFSRRCELRLYATSLVALPETADYVRLPFRFITGINEGDHQLEVSGETGEKWRLSGLGGNFDHFRGALRDGLGAMDLFVQNALAAALPGFSPLDVRALAGLAREGRLVSLAELEKAVPGTAEGLEKRICSDKTDAAEYRRLKSISAAGRTAFCVKKGLPGSFGGDHYQFVFLVDKPVRAAIVESFLPGAKKEEGAADKTATYLYRLPAGGEFLPFFNRAMTAVNFRRMPVLLSEESLASPKYALYAGALARVPELKELRGLYIGRVIHSGTEEWSAGIAAALSFAAGNPAPGARWRKEGGAEDEDEEAAGTAAKEGSNVRI